mgnify:CR=1 FL=1
MSKHKIDDLLVMFFCLVADESSFIQEVVDKKTLLLEALTLLTYQCKASCKSCMRMIRIGLSREVIRTDAVIASLTGILQDYDEEMVPSVIECLLSIVDLNG